MIGCGRIAKRLDAKRPMWRAAITSFISDGKTDEGWKRLELTLGGVKKRVQTSGNDDYGKKDGVVEARNDDGGGMERAKKIRGTAVGGVNTDAENAQRKTGAQEVGNAVDEMDVTMKEKDA